MDFRNPFHRPWREFWEDCLWLMCEAEEMGFDYLMVQEHFFTRDGYAPSIPIFLSQLATRTKRARLGSYLYVLPLHHAGQLAQETAVLDHLSGGRLDVTVGTGHRPAEYRWLGYSPSTRPSRMEEGLEVLKLAWTQRPFDYQGRYYTLKNVEVYPEPYQQPHPPLWVGASAPAGAERAGRYGANLASASVDPEIYTAYARGLEQAGVDIKSVRISNPYSITVTDEDPQKVWERNKALYFDRWDFYRVIRGEMGDVDLAAFEHAPSDDAYRDFELIGDPEMVIATLREFTDTLPLTDIVHSGPAAGIDIRTEGYQSLKRFADSVLPVLKTW